MSALAQFIMRGRSQAILTVCFFTILSWLLSLASLLAAAALALPALRRGPREGLIIAAGALPIVAIAGQLLMGSAVQAAGFALVIWVPMLFVSWVLRATTNLSAAVTATLGIGVISVIGFYAIVDDVSGFWHHQFEVILKPILEQQMQAGGEVPIALTLDLFARYATGSVAAGSVLSVILSLLLARWWQAGLYNPGGFRKEFVAMRLGKPVALTLLAMIGAIFALGGEGSVFMANLALPAFVGFMMAGFAGIHALLSDHPAGRFWLTGLYIGIMFVTPLILVVSLVGLSDSWFDWRHRFVRTKT
jgi:hypothetical protein